MIKLSLRLSAAVLALGGLGACTTTGVGTGQSVGGNVGATFTWSETGATRGNMVASLTTGQVFQGPFFQVTQEARVDDYGPLWAGWGPGYNWGRGWGGRRWGAGWGGWGAWGPERTSITQYTGQVLANLQGPGGYMRCQFTLARPSSGISGGGLGQCQLPSGAIINTQFPPRA